MEEETHTFNLQIGSQKHSTLSDYWIAHGKPVHHHCPIPSKEFNLYQCVGNSNMI